MADKILDPLLYEADFNIDTMGQYFCRKIEDDKSDLEQGEHRRWDRWYADWRDIKPKASKPWTNAANPSSPVSSTATDSLIPRVVEDIFDYAYPIDCEGDNTPEGQILEQEGRQLMKWHIDAHDDLQDNIWHFISNACGLGTSFIYTYWDAEKEYIQETIDVDVPVLTVNGQQVDDEGGKIPIEEQARMLAERQIPFETVMTKQQQTVEHWKWKRYCAKSICLNNKDVIYPKNAESLQDAFETDYVAIKIYKTLDEIYTILEQPEKNPLYANVTKMKAKEFGSIDGNTSDTAQMFNKRNKKIELWLCFGRYPVQRKDKEDSVVALIHPTTKTILGFEKFPYKHGRCPIVAGYIHPQHKKVAGIGIPEKLYDLKSYKDKSWSQRLNLRDLYLAPVVISRKGSGFNKVLHQFGMGQIWTDVNYEDIKVLDINYSEKGMSQDDEMIDKYINNRTGLADFAYGAEPQSDQTFRGLMMILEEGSKSRGMYKKWMAKCTQEIFNQIYMLYQQYWGNPDEYVQEFIGEVLDKNQKRLSPQTLDALKYDLKITLKATNDDKKLRLIKAKETAEYLLQFEEIQTSPVHKRKLVVDTLRAMGNDDPEGSFPTVEEMEALQQQRVNLAIQQQAEAEAKQKEEARQQQIFQTEHDKQMGKNEVISQLEQVANQ